MSSYPTVSEIVVIHDYLIQEFGGKAGIREIGAFESALGRLTSGYYENINEAAAALMESLSQNHPFIDGNKRVSFFVTDVFLRMNGYQINCDNEEAFSFFDKLLNSGSFDWSQ